MNEEHELLDLLSSPMIPNIKKLKTLRPDKVNPILTMTSIILSDNLEMKDYVYKCLEDTTVDVNFEIRPTTNHETFVHLKVLNEMRSYGIPNFPFFYGQFQSADVIVDPETDTIIDWDNSKTTSYCILEKIAGETISEFSKNCSLKEWICYHFQIALAIRSAYLNFDFTHYNLDSDNCVIVKNFDKNIYIPYYCPSIHNDVQIWVESPGIVCFKKCESCSVQVRTDKGLEQFGKKSNPLYDLYKQLCTSLKEMKTIPDKLLPLLKYFGTNYLPDEYIINEDLSLDSYITVIINIIRETPELINIIAIENPPLPILTCRNNFMFQETEFKTLPYAISLLDLYDQVKFRLRRTYLHSDQLDFVNNELAVARLLIDKYPVEIGFQKEKEILTNLLKIVDVDFPLISIPLNLIDFTENIQKTFESFISRAIVFVNTWERILLHKRAIIFFSQGSLELNNEFKLLIDRINVKTDFYVFLMIHLKKQYKLILSEKKSWYQTVLKNFLYL
jgi:hypothetical protein